MGETTGISWTDHTFNPWWGCIRVSPGCEHCYAETFTHRMGLNLWGPYHRRFFGEKHWIEPLKWNAKAAKDGVVRRVFCASMADVFEKFEGLEEQRVKLWDLVVATPNLEWLILTKRPENISDMLPGNWMMNPPDNVRIGITAENQEYFNKRYELLTLAWIGKNFISYEPAIGPLSLYHHEMHPWDSGVDWIICGGESGAGCRPMDISWARAIMHQCKAAGIPFFFKQLGGYPDKRHNPGEWPEDLRVQEFPTK